MTDLELERGNEERRSPDFRSIGVDEVYIELLRKKDIAEPAVIQRVAVPPIGEGRDVIVHSGTGTGKTLAYVLPLLQRMDWSAKELQWLVVVPTQELAMQIVREIEALAGAGKTAALIGGASLQRQLDKLKTHPPIAVGTPGRLAELLKLRKLKLQAVRHVVIDEVDQVFALGVGAAGELEAVLKAVPAERQLVFVTATVTEAVQRVAAKWMDEPVTVRGQSQAEASVAVEHQYIVCERREKIDLVRRLLRTLKPAAALIFVKDTEIIGELEAKLKFAGLQVASLYGDAGKQERAAVMKRFASGKLKLLIASDVAARGIDVTKISHIINFELPADREQYIHRSGRTGRMGRSGAVVTLTTQGERAPLTKLAEKLGIRLQEKRLFRGEWKDAGGGRTRGSVEREREGADERTRGTVEREREGAGERTRGSVERERNGAGDRAQGSVERESKGAAAAGQVAGTAASKTATAAPHGKKPRNRKRDDKNKGAPRWLKEKQLSEHSGPEPR